MTEIDTRRSEWAGRSSPPCRLSKGIPSAVVDTLLGVYRAFRTGWTSIPTDDLATILRRPPQRAIEVVAAVITA
ncbi:hypothetical protein [Nocardia sp. NPDC004604]|uniref:hypothetical protein n=1 Tax=Nocardia sp. NPDC004604 TaxID=3157013 RepID=UPI0033A47D2F